MVKLSYFMRGNCITGYVSRLEKMLKINIVNGMLTIDILYTYVRVETVIW